jgi:hypothetical protein
VNYKILGAAGALLSAGCGFAAGYLYAKRRLETIYAERADAEIEEAGRYFKKLYKADEFETPEAAIEALGLKAAEMKVDPRPSVQALINGLGYRGAASASRDQVIERGPDRPYTIREDEFMDNDSGHDQKSLTYYLSDGVLADDNDEIVDNIDFHVGEANLQTFGELSQDPNTVYVRNERTLVEYEIVRHEGSYAEVVHGITKD